MTRPRTSDNGVAKTPPMGWNSWNSFGGNPSEALVTQMADAMIDSGMRDVGYEYVVVDDCWFDPDRDAAGNLAAAADRFPSGMKAIGDYLHERGLKFGIYAGPLGKTCAQYSNDYPGATGSEGHEEADAQQFAAWGVDFLKYDWCSPVGSIDEQVEVFARMRDCLAATGRPMVFSINPNSFHTKTGPDRDWGDVANMWRTTEDIRELWDRGNDDHDYPMGVRNIVEVTLPLADQARPGAWNDMDMLEVGRDGLTEEEQRTHFALWAVMSSPLIAGNDLRTMTDATRDLLTNVDLIAMNQDPLGIQAKQVSFDGTCRVLAKPLANGDIGVALYNQGDTATTITTSAAAVGKIGAGFTLRDAWTGATTTTTATISADVPAHGVVVFRLGSAAA